VNVSETNKRSLCVCVGCEKLGISANGCKVVLEEDGTEIDEDELLQEFVGSTLMLLQPDDKWSSASAQSKQPQPAVMAAGHKTTHEGTEDSL